MPALLALAAACTFGVADFLGGQCTRRAAVVAVTLTTAAVLAAGPQVVAPVIADDDYWRMTQDFSERAGTFQSDNLLSNERWFQHVVPPLVQKAKQNRVYVGVGPEQNFTYIIALKPKLAFIVDIRRGNFDLHLMYKALFEMSADRAEFVSRFATAWRGMGLTGPVLVPRECNLDLDHPAIETGRCRCDCIHSLAWRSCQGAKGLVFWIGAERLAA